MNVYSLPVDDFMPPRGYLAAQALVYLWDAAERGQELDEEALHAKLATGAMVCIVAVEDDHVVGAAGAETVHHPTGCVLHVTLLGGSRLDDWLPELVETLDHGCRRIGAHRTEVVGRPGWAKALKPYGTEMNVVMVREVPSGQGSD